jgi:hypothetical protein
MAPPAGVRRAEGDVSKGRAKMLDTVAREALRHGRGATVAPRASGTRLARSAFDLPG